MASRQRPATTPEARESQLAAAAMNLAEQQLLDGTASAQVITHFLKLASSREKVEQERIKNENLLMQAKIEGIKSAANIEKLYTEALDAMRNYRGESTPPQEEEYYD